MQERMLRVAQVKNITGLGRSTIYEMMNKREFPPSRKIGARSVAWPESAVIEWVKSRPISDRLAA